MYGKRFAEEYVRGKLKENINKNTKKNDKKFIIHNAGGAVPLRFLVKTAITVVTQPVVSHSFPLPVTSVYHSRTATGSPYGRQSTLSRLHGGFILRQTGGAVPLRFLIKTAITVVTPPVVFNSFPLPVTHLTAVEPPRDRRRVASLHFRDCTAVVLRRNGGDGCKCPDFFRL